jgi:hypothetical protein
VEVGIPIDKAPARGTTMDVAAGPQGRGGTALPPTSAADSNIAPAGGEVKSDKPVAGETDPAVQSPTPQQEPTDGAQADKPAFSRVIRMPARNAQQHAEQLQGEVDKAQKRNAVLEKLHASLQVQIQERGGYDNTPPIMREPSTKSGKNSIAYTRG